ncbi:MAG: trigger factor [Deltaproteobacteria bacterium]|nr:trigger factor [Deltaproteobacteria bacterium]MBN2674291.1 trigger factor [Deltaproteobacteria bacterium]
MSSRVNKISPVVQELNITIPADEISKTAETMFAQVRKRAKVKGFRQGKMPMAIAKKMFSQSVYAELTSDLTYRFFLEAIREHELSPVGEPKFSNIESLAKAGENYEFTVTVETAPRLESIHTDGIVLKKNKVTADPEVVETELKRLQSSLATTKELEKARPVALGDSVKLELRRKEESGEWSENALPQELVLEAEQCPKELLDLVPGMNVGDEKEVTFGAERENPMTFLTKVIEHKERILPALDDDFAKDLGDFDTLDALKADIEKRYVDSLENKEKDALKQKLFDALRENNAMELPPTILARQTDAMRSQYENIVNQVSAAKKEAKGEDTEKTDAGEAAMDDSAQKAAHEIVHTHFLIEEIARIGELKVEESDIEAKFKEMSEATGLPLARLKAEYSDRKYAAELESRILEDKVFDFIAPKVTIEEVEPGTEAKSSSAKKPAAKKAATKKAAETNTAAKLTTTPKTTGSSTESKKKTSTKKKPATKKTAAKKDDK